MSLARFGRKRSRGRVFRDAARYWELDRTFFHGNTFRIAPPRVFFNVASHSPQRQRAPYSRSSNTGSRLLAFRQRFISLWIYIPWYSSPFLYCGPAVFFIISFSWLATDKHVLFLSRHLCCGFWVHSLDVYFVICPLFFVLVRIFLGILRHRFLWQGVCFQVAIKIEIYDDCFKIRIWLFLEFHLSFIFSVHLRFLAFLFTSRKFFCRELYFYLYPLRRNFPFPP